MSTYDDFDGVYFSIQALRMYHRIVKQEALCEIIVIDNNPDSASGRAVADFAKKANVKYIPFTTRTGTAVRNEIFRNASGQYTISMDCHVLFEQRAIETFLDYMHVDANQRDIVQGPLIYDNLVNFSTHFKPGWGSGMYGKWETDQESLAKGEAFDIPMQGLGVFGCKTSSWLGFNKHFRGFGGEEGYIHEKFRQAGGRSVCLPNFKWLHRFGRPLGVKYPLNMNDRIWNYYVGWLELTQDPEHQMIKDITSHFLSLNVPLTTLNKLFNEASQLIL